MIDEIRALPGDEPTDRAIAINMTTWGALTALGFGIAETGASTSPLAAIGLVGIIALAPAAGWLLASLARVALWLQTRRYREGSA